MKKEYFHIPVLLEEVLDFLNPSVGGFFIDCTLGGGGYTRKLAEKIGPKGKVLAIDLDAKALGNFGKKKVENVFLHKGNFRNLEKAVEKYFDKDKKFDGVVMDLGLSSAQVDDEDRGFSFVSKNLNMNFGDEGESVEKIINEYSQRDLTDLFFKLGEEKNARLIAKKIIAEREKKKIKSGKELAEIIERSLPSAVRRKRKVHPATLIFQALRIKANSELDALEEGLEKAIEVLRPGGRLAVVSFHSLEDRIVKNFFKFQSRKCICPAEIPICVCSHKQKLKILTKKPLIAMAEEVDKNPRARSAKLRVAEKI